MSTQSLFGSSTQRNRLSLSMYSTVGCRRTGLDGPSLDRSYFSRLQPILFLFSDPSSSHIAKLVHIRYSISMLHTHACATHAGPGKRLKCFSTRRRGVVSKSAMPLKKSSSQQTLFACSSELMFSYFRKIPAWPFFGTRQYCTPVCSIAERTPMTERSERHS